MSETRLTELETSLTRLSERQHSLELRVGTLEAGMQRVERQLDLVFAQGQANSKALGEQRVVLDRVASLLEQLVRQKTPSIEVRGE